MHESMAKFHGFTHGRVMETYFEDCMVPGYLSNPFMPINPGPKYRLDNLTACFLGNSEMQIGKVVAVTADLKCLARDGQDVLWKMPIGIEGRHTDWPVEAILKVLHKNRTGVPRSVYDLIVDDLFCFGGMELVNPFDSEPNQ